MGMEWEYSPGLQEGESVAGNKRMEWQHFLGLQEGSFHSPSEFELDKNPKSPGQASSVPTGDQGRQSPDDKGKMPFSRVYHPFLNGTPCDKQGNMIPPNAPPPPQNYDPADNWAPFKSCIEFEFTDFAFHHNQMSAGDINELLDIWAASLFQHRDHPPFADHNDLYMTINAIPHGDIPWQSFSTSYKGITPDKQEDVPS
ncbi:hypothetical protein BJV74DRAFT_800246 [Russula compacta]|nr:hypothetical protein BJV74DRAFT_800246 [Russula compacta]